MKTETAKEVLRKHIDASLYTLTKRGTDKLEYWISQAMIEYAESKCSEQRENCANAHKEKLKEYWNVLYVDALKDETDNIKSAPKPDFK